MIEEKGTTVCVKMPKDLSKYRTKLEKDQLNIQMKYSKRISQGKQIEQWCPKDELGHKTEKYELSEPNIPVDELKTNNRTETKDDHNLNVNKTHGLTKAETCRIDKDGIQDSDDDDDQVVIISLKERDPLILSNQIPNNKISITGVSAEAKKVKIFV